MSAQQDCITPDEQGLSDQEAIEAAAEFCDEPDEAASDSKDSAVRGKMKRRKQSFVSMRQLEIVVAILLSVTALLMAWATWMSELHGSHQDSSYATGQRLSAEASAAQTLATMTYAADYYTWEDILALRSLLIYACETNDTAYETQLQYQLDTIMTEKCTEEFAANVEWALEQGGSTTPFDREGCGPESYYEESMRLSQEADDCIAQGDKDNFHADAFGLVRVFYSVVLFLLGIFGVYKDPTARKIILACATLMFLLGLILMFVLPLPVDFDLFTYFSPRM